MAKNNQKYQALKRRKGLNLRRLSERFIETLWGHVPANALHGPCPLSYLHTLLAGLHCMQAAKAAQGKIRKLLVPTSVLTCSNIYETI